MVTIQFRVPGKPVGKQHKTVGGRLFPTQNSRAFMERIRAAGASAMLGLAPFSGSVQILVFVVYEVPASFSKKKRARVLSLDQPYWGPYDLDNYLKCVLDGLKGVAFEDDRQVTRITADKRPGETPGVWIYLITETPDATELP